MDIACFVNIIQDNPCKFYRKDSLSLLLLQAAQFHKSVSIDILKNTILIYKINYEDITVKSLKTFKKQIGKKVIEDEYIQFFYFDFEPEDLNYSITILKKYLEKYSNKHSQVTIYNVPEKHHKKLSFLLTNNFELKKVALLSTVNFKKSIISKYSFYEPFNKDRNLGLIDINKYETGDLFNHIQKDKILICPNILDDSNIYKFMSFIDDMYLTSRKLRIINIAPLLIKINNANIVLNFYEWLLKIVNSEKKVINQITLYFEVNIFTVNLLTDKDFISVINKLNTVKILFTVASIFTFTLPRVIKLTKLLKDIYNPNIFKFILEDNNKSYTKNIFRDDFEPTTDLFDLITKISYNVTIDNFNNKVNEIYDIFE